MIENQRMIPLMIVLCHHFQADQMDHRHQVVVPVAVEVVPVVENEKKVSKAIANHIFL